VTLQANLSTLDKLPAIVARLSAIYAAADELAEIEYPGAGVLAYELENALEALDGAPGALLYLAGIRHAGGDAERFERWDVGVAARMNLGDLT
jgi:hypothetical protein